MTAGETVLRERTLRLPVSGAAQSFLEIIRFAAANHLCVDLEYGGSVRRIEPYSLRRTRDGNIVLHAIRASDGGHHSYRIDRIQGAQTTGQSFTPRYVVELSPEGSVIIPPNATRSVPTRTPRSRRRRVSWPSGPRYIYECSYCGKHFTRQTTTSRLNPHKDKSGYPCPGRVAIYVETRY